MKKKKIILISVIVLIVIGLVFFIFFPKVESSFDVNPVLLKSVIKQGESSGVIFRVTNFGEEKNFKIGFASPIDFILLETNNFGLDSLQSKEIGIIFNASKSVPGVYVNSLIVDNGLEQKQIPIILEVQTREVFFAIKLDVGLQYKVLEKTDDTFTDIKFFNLRDFETYSVNVNYVVQNLKGEIVQSEDELVIISPETAILKTMPLPDNIEFGNYVFSIVAKYDDYVSTSSYLFNVVDKKRKPGFLFDINFFSLIVLVLLIAIVFLISYMFYERNKLFSQLKHTHSSELKFYSRKIDNQKIESLAEAKTDKEKKKIVREFSHAKEKVLSAMKREQAKQKKEFRKLAKRKDKKLIKKKVNEWKSGVYARALRSAELSSDLKLKLGTLKKAYAEGYISEESYKKGSSRIRRKLK